MGTCQTDPMSFDTATALRAQHPLLRRAPHKDRAALRLLGHLPLAKARVHEMCGPARRSLALWLAMQTQGPLLWIAPDWSHDRLHPDGFRHWIDPARLVFVRVTSQQDALWCLEDALRAGTLPLIIGEMGALPELTHVRRMHLAAEQGAKEGGTASVGVVLTPNEGGAAGVETRWHMSPQHSDTKTRWRLTRARARTDPQKVWDIVQTDQGAPMLERQTD